MRIGTTSAGPAPFSVSVVMATFNGGAHLATQLRTIATQRLRPDELVVSDDVSSDDTVAIIERFRATAPFPVRLYRHERNVGFADNFLGAALRARHGWIAFADQDDEWEDGKLLAVRAAAAAPDVGFVVHPSSLLRDGRLTGERVGPSRAGTFPPLTLHPLGDYNGHSIALRRDLFALLPPAGRPRHVHDPSRLMPHDDWATFLGTALGTTVILAEALVRYRLHDGQVSGRGNRGAGLVEIGRRGILSSIEEARKHEYATRARLAQLRLIATSDPLLGPRVDQAIRYYEAMSATQRRRVALWEAPSRASRLTRFGHLLATGRYGRFGTGGVGGRTALKDLLFGVIRGDASRGGAGRTPWPPEPLP